MAANKAKTTSTKPRRQIRFDTHAVEYCPCIVSGKSTLDKWTEKPNAVSYTHLRAHETGAYL
eukprot:7264011-Pyramimonas_sp.AAC.1